MVDIFIIKGYGATLLQHDENDVKWDFIENCYQVLSTFEKLSELNIDEIRELEENINVQLSILNNEELFSSTVIDCLLDIVKILDIAVLRRNSINNDVCCSHSSFYRQIVKTNCDECKQLDIMILSSDDDDNEIPKENYPLDDTPINVGIVEDLCSSKKKEKEP